ncbi:hypothetical protein RN001_012702 [Aquatica leii]|uniref:Tetraspanin n=1 Tax=Aquatica leii TaxID=1421715 RepID=A0AAN7NYS2_9COLE|nr:hypothetical protein RN001_012702 [Aquatica leii]
MTLAWTSSCIKYLLFVFNLLFVITGIIILSLGVSIKAYFTNYDFFLDDKYFSTPNLLIAIGTIIFLVAFFGCCGAIKESFCMTITFSVLLILIFVLEFAAGISGYVLRNQTADFLVGKLNSTMYQYEPNKTDANASRVWDGIQTEFKCCGVHNYTDWYGVKQLQEMLPLSCCGPQWGSVGTGSCNANTNTLYQKGCVEGFGEFVEDNAFTLASAALVLAFIQLLGIIFACHLSKQIKKNYETV